MPGNDGTTLEIGVGIVWDAARMDIYLREFVGTTVSLNLRRVWKGGSQPHSVDHFQGIVGIVGIRG